MGTANLPHRYHGGIPTDTGRSQWAKSLAKKKTA